MLECDRRHLADDRVGTIERCAIRQLREGDEVLLVLRRHEPRGHTRKPRRRQTDEADVEQDRHRRYAQHAPHAGAVGV